MIKELPYSVYYAKRAFPEAYRLHAVDAGEFVLGVLGEPNERDVCSPYPRHEEFGANGSYVMVRQMEEHVGPFNKMVKDLAAQYGSEEDDPQELAAAKIVGRHHDGTPPTNLPPENGSFCSFGFAERDAAGLLCPLGSHIRQATPSRDSREHDPEISLGLSKRHRFLGRGRIYGAETSNEDFKAKDVKGQGALFNCTSADIAQQFEFIQQRLLNSSTSAGIEGEVDPIVSRLEPSEARFTAPARMISPIVCRERPLTTVKGAGYFFLPGKKALAWLAS